jgi:hypothetical protein
MSKLAQTVQTLANAIFQQVTPPSRAEVKQAAKAQQTAWIAEVRAAVFAMDPACICGQCRRSDTDQMHEVVSRAKTRGQPIETRFNTGNCVRLSRACHAMVTGEVGHGQRLAVTFADPVLMAHGDVLLTWTDGRTRLYRRRVATRRTR